MVVKSILAADVAVSVPQLHTGQYAFDTRGGQLVWTRNAPTFQLPIPAQNVVIVETAFYIIANY